MLKTRLMTIAVTAGFLSACSIISGPQFSGESTTYGGGNIVRNDVLSQIRRIELMQNCHNITAVQSHVDDARKVNGRIRAQETWTVTACGKQQVYLINLLEDERGETDFSVQATK